MHLLVSATYNTGMTVNATRTKMARLGARVKPTEKALLQHAADLRGQTLTQFLLTSAREAAEDVIRRHEVVVLSAEDSMILAEALLNPPPPNEHMRAAFADYQRFINDQS